MNKFREIEVFLKEYDSVKRLGDIADLQATLKHAEKLMCSLTDIDFEDPATYEAHTLLCHACEEMSGYIQDPIGHLLDEWQHTPTWELIPEETKIIKVWEDYMHSLGLDPATLYFSDDEYLWALTDLVREIGIAKAEDNDAFSVYEDPEKHEERIQAELEMLMAMAAEEEETEDEVLDELARERNELRLKHEQVI